MPHPPRRLRTAGRRLWTDVQARRRFTIHEGILLARACELADQVARLEELTLAEAPDASDALSHELERSRAHLGAALGELGLPDLLPPVLVHHDSVA